MCDFGGVFESRSLGPGHGPFPSSSIRQHISGSLPGGLPSHFTAGAGGVQALPWSQWNDGRRKEPPEA